MRVVTFNIATNGSGAYTSTSDDTTVVSQIKTEGPYLLYAVEWVDGTLADGVDAVLSQINTPSGVDTTLLTLTNADNDAWYYPRVDAHSTAGAALSSGADVTAERALQVVSGQLKLAVTSGDASKTGKCIVYLKCA